jgi:hypothetical protein
VRHVRMLGLCLVAAFAVGALAASSSSAALPEWGKCLKLPATIKGKEKKANTGKFSNSNCSEATTGGEFEFVKGTSELPNVAFENNMTSSEAVLETSLGVQVKCTAQSAKGQLSGTKEVSNVEVRFKGCQANLLEFTCENFFEEQGGIYRYTQGEIFTRSLKGKLVYISGAGTASPVVGLQLEPAEKNNLFAFFGCGTKGAATPILFSQVGRKPTGPNGGDKIVSPITPLNQMGTETTQVYAAKRVENPETHELEIVKGVQEPNEINGKPAFLETQILDGFGEITWSSSSQEETAVTKLVSGEELEIKA